jgi:hypothetical protein
MHNWAERVRTLGATSTALRFGVKLREMPGSRDYWPFRAGVRQGLLTESPSSSKWFLFGSPKTIVSNYLSDEESIA